MEQLSHDDLINKLSQFLTRHSCNEKSKKDNEVFVSLYKQFLTENAHIDWSSWKHISPNVQKNLSDIPRFDSSRRDVLDKTVVIKLNGGLGTTMGCSAAKSFINLRDNLSFLDFVIVQHADLNTKYNCQIPLYLMNSFYTDEMTRAKLDSYEQVQVQTFVQSKCPRISKKTLLPITDENWGEDAWYPPGHGNIFQSMENSGTLNELISQGKEIIFVSNIDNTGATLELSIAQFMLDNDIEYIMECTDKTENDIKGGTLIEIDNQLMHLEIPQVPPENLDDFCSTRIFKIFNTNNIWVNLKAIKNKIGTIKSEIIVNNKKVRGEDIIQLETSIGGCIKNFKHSYCIHVERNRFRPVKRVEDLVIMSSDLFELKADHTLELQTDFIPKISLGSYFNTIDKMNERMEHIPSLKYAKSFIVRGDIKFGKNITIKGDVIIENNTDKQVTIDDNTIVENRTLNFN